MTFYFLILFVFYFVLLIVLRIGWTKAVALKETQSSEKTFFISVVVAMRNEENNIENLVHDLSNQNYLPSYFEIIIVDDHSADESIHRARTINTSQNLSVISLNGSKGKKAALTHGIRLAKGDIIVTTDADCTLQPNWLTHINSMFQNHTINMVAGMVAIANENKFFSQWQQMEFASVMGTGAAAFGFKKPLMCNGANLSFRKKIFEEVKGYEGNALIASGDDEFLMRKILKQNPESVQLLNTPETMVATKPQPSLTSFLYQRIRWASKWKRNPSLSAKLLAVVILFLQATWVFFLFTIRNYNYKVIAGIIILKIFADLVFLLPVFNFMKIKFKLLPFLGLQFLYPFYVIFVGLLAPWISYRWKDRKIL